MLSENFWIFFVTAGSAALLAIIRVCYKSKCKKIGICGLSIERDVTVEIANDEQPVTPTTKE